MNRFVLRVLVRLSMRLVEYLDGPEYLQKCFGLCYRLTVLGRPSRGHYLVRNIQAPILYTL